MVRLELGTATCIEEGRDILTQERLKELIHYNPETGVFTWNGRFKGVKKSRVAGCITSQGYVLIRIDGVLYKAHRLAFLYMTGRFPEKDVDHMNGNPGDNRWTNLRNVSHSENMRNVLHKAASSKYTGVSFCSATGRWKSQINLSGKNRNLGRFLSEKEACAAYLMELAEHHGEEAATILHGRIVAATAKPDQI